MYMGTLFQVSLLTTMKTQKTVSFLCSLSIFGLPREPPYFPQNVINFSCLLGVWQHGSQHLKQNLCNGISILTLWTYSTVGWLRGQWDQDPTGWTWETHKIILSPWELGICLVAPHNCYFFHFNMSYQDILFLLLVLMKQAEILEANVAKNWGQPLWAEGHSL